jgi:transcriptional regulator NrdR family protein
MSCGVCGGPQMRVMETSPQHKMIIRSRRCAQCGAIFETREVIHDKIKGGTWTLRLRYPPLTITT